MRATDMTPKQRANAMTQANDVIDMIEPMFDSNTMDESQFTLACAMYAKAVIIKAQLSSMEGETK